MTHRIRSSALSSTIAAVNVGLTIHAAVNTHRQRRLPDTPHPNLDLTPTPPTPQREGETVAVLVPARNEAHRISDTLQSLAAQQGLGQWHLVVLDDHSDDGTADLAADLLAAHPTPGRSDHVISGTALPPGWLGKPFACHQLARFATDLGATALVFVDADVHLEPHAIAGTVTTLRAGALAGCSVWPRQIADDPLGRLIQPLLGWSWAATLPLGVSERSRIAALTAACGQVIAFDTAAYHAFGGHAAVADRVLEDLAIAARCRTTGGRFALVNGTDQVSCRMYDSPAEVRAGYRKSLWTAFGGPIGSVAVAAGLAGLTLAPIPRALRGDRAARLAVGAGIASRVVTGRALGDRIAPDALAHPLGIAALLALMADSQHAHRTGSAQWKGRTVTPPAAPPVPYAPPTNAP